VSRTAGPIFFDRLQLNMSDIVLHHFNISPFGEKVRLALGLKGLSWHSVQIPLVMPKPDLTALTGGYRKTPVMQIGADIYCDTRRIALELEARFSGPSLFPANSRAAALALASWSDVALFQPGAGLSLGTNEGLPEDILADRMAFFDFLETETLPALLPHYFSQFRANLGLLDEMLADGRSWLTGEAPGWADIAAYTPVWMCRGNIQGADALLAPLENLEVWEARVAALGHGRCSELTADDALAIARDSDSIVGPDVWDDAFPRAAIGQGVSVAAQDYGKDEVVGELVQLTHETVAVARTDSRAGQVVVHFPRAGYHVEVL
jgi:glutathione S-transferase